MESLDESEGKKAMLNTFCLPRTNMDSSKNGAGNIANKAMYHLGFSFRPAGQDHKYIFVVRYKWRKQFWEWKFLDYEIEENFSSISTDITVSWLRTQRRWRRRLEKEPFRFERSWILSPYCSLIIRLLCYIIRSPVCASLQMMLTRQIIFQNVIKCSTDKLSQSEETGMSSFKKSQKIYRKVSKKVRMLIKNIHTWNGRDFF